MGEAAATGRRERRRRCRRRRSYFTATNTITAADADPDADVDAGGATDGTLSPPTQLTPPNQPGTAGALQMLGADAMTEGGDLLVAAELLWTPSEDDEVLEKRDVVVDYPEIIDF